MWLITCMQFLQIVDQFSHLAFVIDFINMTPATAKVIFKHLKRVKFYMLDLQCFHIHLSYSQVSWFK